MNKKHLLPDDMQFAAVDGAGHLIDKTGTEVRDVLEDMLETDAVIAVVLRNADGEIGILVPGEPSQEILEAFEDLVRTYRAVLFAPAVIQ
jgi:hypothetical protein